MKATPAKRMLVMNMIADIADQIACPMPKVFLTRKEYLSVEYTQSRTVTHRKLGMCHVPQKSNPVFWVFINIKRHDSTADLKETVYHEMTHARFPYLPHGRKFEAKMREIAKGKRFIARRIKGKNYA